MPTSVHAVAGNGTATVTWDAPNNNGDPIIYYTVTAVPESGQRTSVDVAGTESTHGVTNGIGYTFEVTATNSMGPGEAGVSNRVVPAGPPSTPEPPVATAGDAAADLYWFTSTANGAAVTYTVKAYPGAQLDPAAIDETTDTAMTIGPLTNGTPYTFTVTATNSAGTSPESGRSNSVTPEGPCPEEGTQEVQAQSLESIPPWPPWDDCDPVIHGECDNGDDDDGDGRTDYEEDGSGDPGCTSSGDRVEDDNRPACSNGTDDDADLHIDHPADPDCTSPGDDSEIVSAPACSNGADDDSDGAVDQGDWGCAGAGDTSERDPVEDDPRFQKIVQLTNRIDAGEHPFGQTGDCTGSRDQVDCPGESVVVPLPAGSPSCTAENICAVTVHEELDQVVRLLMEAIDSRDWEYLLTYVGGRVERECKNGQTGQYISGCISQHALGAAMDVRPLADNDPTRWNQIVNADPNMGRLIDLFAHLGFGWGGNFGSNFDPQHFQFVGTSAAADDLVESKSRGYLAP